MQVKLLPSTDKLLTDKLLKETFFLFNFFKNINGAEGDASCSNIWRTEKPSRQKCVDSIDFAKKYTITKAYMHKIVYSIRKAHRFAISQTTTGNENRPVSSNMIPWDIVPPLSSSYMVLLLDHCIKWQTIVVASVSLRGMAWSPHDDENHDENDIDRFLCISTSTMTVLTPRMHISYIL